MSTYDSAGFPISRPQSDAMSGVRLEEVEQLYGGLTPDGRDELLECLLIAAPRGGEAMIRVPERLFLCRATKGVARRALERRGTHCVTRAAGSALLQGTEVWSLLKLLFPLVQGLGQEARSGELPRPSQRH